MFLGSSARLNDGRAECLRRGHRIVQQDNFSSLGDGRFKRNWLTEVARRLRSTDVLETLAELFMTYGIPAHVGSDNGSEFTAELVRLWLEALDVQTLFIEPGSPWENGYVESFNGKLRDELLDREIFYTLTASEDLVERWRREYITVCQGRSKIRPRWRSKTRPSGRGSKFLTAASRGGVRKWEGPCVGGPSCCVRGDSCRR